MAKGGPGAQNEQEAGVGRGEHPGGGAWGTILNDSKFHPSIIWKTIINHQKNYDYAIIIDGFKEKL